MFSAVISQPTRLYFVCCAVDNFRGGWSAGLQKQDDANSGVDSTASGVLFQSRPYPSPGAILKTNKAAATAGPKRPG